MKKEFLKICFIKILIISTIFAQQDLTKYVDVFIGTDGHGHTYPGATLPFGMIQVSPDTRTDNWDACGGYHYSDTTIIGFSHQHLSGVGCLDYGDILFMPTIGEIKWDAGKESSSKVGYRSGFSHSSEKAEPGYYSVYLNDYSIKAELAATLRAAIHKYTYNKGKKQNLIIDLSHQLASDEKIKKLEIKIIDKNKICGLRHSAGWAKEQIVYFYAEFSKEIKNSAINKDGEIFENITFAEGNSLKANLEFENNQEPLLTKVGISAVDYEGAKNNLLSEISNWDFDKVKNDAKKIWNTQLNKIKVKDSSIDKKKIFYTALYHSSLVPNVYFDFDRRYRGNDREVHCCKEFDNYTVFSLWDTFRATHPLFILIEPERTTSMINSLLAKYKESGFLPKWELAGNETGTMIGYHAVSVIVDAYLKGIEGFDTELALEALIKSANNKSIDINLYKDFHYIPSDRRIESVSKTLEYAYDDWCIARFAEAIGKDDIAEAFVKRALNYINLFDGSTGFFRGKQTNGNWDSPFDPFEISRNYTEANAWQYSMFVPHDVKGLINLYGSKKNLSEHLDRLFTAKERVTGKELLDVSGLIGQYAHGNEPSHHVAYLYNFVEQPWKTQERINQINREMYSTKSDGIIGNEDCGQMSSWFNFSSLGFYPFCPGSNQYQIGSPFFEEVSIKLGNDKKFLIKTKNLSEKNIFVKEIKLNGKILKRYFLYHKEIMNGGILEFEMGNEPNKTFVSDSSYSLTETVSASIPYIKENVGYFLNNVTIEFGCRTKDTKIYYTLDGTEPTQKSRLYDKPFRIDESTHIMAKAFKKRALPSATLIVNSVKAKIKKASEYSKEKQGINYKYFEGEFSSAYDLKGAEIIEHGYQNYISLEKAKKEDDYGFIFSGYIKIPEDGIYIFHCKSDDGSILLIDNEEVVNNDGSHAAVSASGAIALEKGFHPFELFYFEDYEGNSVEVFWESQKIKKEKLPQKVLFR